MEGGGEGGGSPGSHSSFSWSKSSLDVKADTPPMLDMTSSMEASVAEGEPQLTGVYLMGTFI